MRSKIINIFYYLSIVSLAAGYVFFSFSLTAKKIEAAGGISMGGRVVTVIPETCPVGVQNTVCTCACASNNCVTITPYGGANQPISCLPMTMQTSGGPVSAGGLILGLFSTLSQTVISVPIGIVGTGK